MATAAPQLSNTVDSAGLSVVTSPRNALDTRYGGIYDPVNLAAGNPVYFHPLAGNQYLALFRERWTDATFSVTQMGFDSDHTQVLTPSWVQVDASTGQSSTVNGSYTIPTRLPYDTLTLESATSRTGYLFTLNTLTKSSIPQAHVQFFHSANFGPQGGQGQNLVLAREEIIPSMTADGQTVLFNRGVMLWQQYLVFAGAGQEDGKIYFSRKTWGAIGDPTIQWEFLTATGWHAGESPASVGVVSDGPVSLFQLNGSVWMSVVSIREDDSTYATVLTANNLSATTQWTQLPYSIWLGKTGTSYLGGTLQFQSLLNANASHPLTNDPNTKVGVPYVYGFQASSDEESQLDVVWDIFPIQYKVGKVNQNITPDYIESQESVGDPSALEGYLIVPDFIPSAEWVGQPSLTLAQAYGARTTVKVPNPGTPMYPILLPQRIARQPVVEK